MSNTVEVIGAGWGRTGTSSLKKALEMLGYDPCYHMTEAIHKNQTDFWLKVANGEMYDFDEVFNSPGSTYSATVDCPSSLYWKEQLQRYPDAKVILTVRDSEKWFQSCKDTIFQCIPNSPYLRWGVRVSFAWISTGFFAMGKKLFDENCFHGDWSKKNIIRHYEEHNARVLAECPKEKLLVFSVSEGWEPLCAFLGKPVPSEPFPHVNDTAEFQSKVQMLDYMGCAVNVFGLGLPWLGVQPVTSTVDES